MSNDPPPINDSAPTTAYVCLNGEIMRAEHARVNVLDHGLLYGDGLFETLRIVGGRCFQAEAHLDRLSEASGRLRIRLPWSRQELRHALQDTIAANGAATGAVRLTVTRGAGAPVPSPSACAAPTFFITYRSSGAVQLDGTGGGLRLALGPAHPRLFVPGIKSLCYLPYQLARLRAQAEGFDDAILHFAGDAVETTVSNLFIVKSGAVLTPDLDSGCLPGVTRALVLRLCAELGVAASEAPAPLSELPGAAEVFVTNSLQGVLPVAVVGDACIGDGHPGPITLALQRGYERELERMAGQGPQATR